VRNVVLQFVMPTFQMICCSGSIGVDIKTLVRRAAVLPLVPIEHIQDIWFNALVDINLADTNINTESKVLMWLLFL
jgi:hypothetical protein